MHFRKLKYLKVRAVIVILLSEFAYLSEEPWCDKSQAAVLPVEAVVVCVEREVIQVEESVDKQIIWLADIFQTSVISFTFLNGLKKRWVLK